MSLLELLERQTQPVTSGGPGVAQSGGQGADVVVSSHDRKFRGNGVRFKSTILASAYPPVDGQTDLPLVFHGQRWLPGLNAREIWGFTPWGPEGIVADRSATDGRVGCSSDLAIAILEYMWRLPECPGSPSCRLDGGLLVRAVLASQ